MGPELRAGPAQVRLRAGLIMWQCQAWSPVLLFDSHKARLGTKASLNLDEVHGSLD